MKKLYLIMASMLCMALVYSCSKSSDGKSTNPNGTSTTTTTSTDTINYTVNNVQNITLSAYDSASLSITTTFVSGKQQAVNLLISGLPANVTVTPSSTTSGTPSFTTTFVFHTTNVAAGTYPITLTATSAGTTAKTYSFNLIVNAVNCASLVAGTYNNCQNACTSGNSNSTYTNIVSTTSIANQISISNFADMGQAVIANVICGADSIYIPAQTINGLTVIGKGTFIATSTDHFIGYNYYFIYSGDTISKCTEILTHN